MITSTKNSQIVNTRKLMQRKHRTRQNRFLVEGLQLLAIAVDVLAQAPENATRIKPLELFYSETLFTGETAPRLLAQLSRAGATTIPVTPNVLNALSERDVSQGLIATFALQPLEWSIEALQSNLISRKSTHPDLILILDKLQDPGNLGTIIRTADAVGVSAIILLKPCVDPFDPKTVRGTMGSLFTVPFARTQNIETAVSPLLEMGYSLVGADGKLGSTVWKNNLLRGSTVLVLGNEARGLSPQLHHLMTGFVSLPLHGHAESLNVSIAAGTLMYEWLRVNSHN